MYTLPSSFTSLCLTRKRVNCERIATWGRRTPRQSLSALITMPCQVWSRWTYPLPYYSVFCCWYITLRCDLDFWPYDLDFWPLTLNICSVWPVTWWNFVPNLSAIEQSVAELLWFQYLNICYGLRSVNFDQVRTLTIYPCPNYSVFWCWYVMSRFDPLTLKVRGASSVMHAIKVSTKFERNRAIPGWIMDNFANFCTRHVTLWP